MKLQNFSYHLPDELIAQSPASPRDHARLLVLGRRSGRIEHRRFFDIEDYFAKGDVLVLNDSTVIPARLIGKKESGGRAEVFLSKKLNSSRNERWECLLRGKRLQPGSVIMFSRTFSARIEAKDGDTWTVIFSKSGKEFERALKKYGATPLPPYIKPSGKNDAGRYQTVYADKGHAGSVAAPTAGLHFTPRLLNRLKKKGIIIKKITLHVGLGTFLPVRVDNIKKHRMHGEWVEVKAEVKQSINAARKRGNKVVAVGTTTVRSLEAAYLNSPTKAFRASVDIFIYPPFTFKAVDAMITNFHLPESTLLMLVSAFAGRKHVLHAYEEAIRERYRFYSFGDAMLII